MLNKYSEIMLKQYKISIGKGISMPNIRKNAMRKYNISPYRYMELYYYCLQYQEWKDELRYNTSNIKSINTSEAATPGYTSDAIEKLAIRRMELEEKCKIIEESAKEADNEIMDYILKAVTNEGITYNYLKTIMNIPCGHNQWYEIRRKFYWILSKKMK